MNKVKNNGTTANLGFEAKPWAAADALRNHMDAAEYKLALGKGPGTSHVAAGQERRRLWLSRL